MMRVKRRRRRRRRKRKRKRRRSCPPSLVWPRTHWTEK